MDNGENKNTIKILSIIICGLVLMIVLFGRVFSTLPDIITPYSACGERCGHG